ncbi:MAG: dihydroorotate dehydrogenase electron transfer subunit [Candidatus Electronema sp. V4]|uniref:dihydroorotate dehydrogenase electron transfer subunit n=1 Tax=Candidatus Electronema sp. V4 TaxID=3454756 RepID=UPI0040555273
MPTSQLSRILANDRLTADVFRLTIHAPEIAAAASPGQFVMVQVSSSLDPLLRRPFSIHSRSADGSLSLLFKVIGKGTVLLAQAKPADAIDLLGPLGKGFDLTAAEKPVCLIGGGMGIAPLLFLAQELPGRKYALLGARNREELAPLAKFFADSGCAVQLATDDGSLGHHGFIPDLLDAVLPDVRLVCTCGPKPMMRSVASKCRQAGTPCQVSVETHMACGMGACLGCAVPGRDGSYVHVCKEGPVFNSEELAWAL